MGNRHNKKTDLDFAHKKLAVSPPRRLSHKIFVDVFVWSLPHTLLSSTQSYKNENFTHVRRKSGGKGGGLKNRMSGANLSMLIAVMLNVDAAADIGATRRTSLQNLASLPKSHWP